MFKQIRKKAKSSKGESLISGIIVIPFIIMLLITFIDFGLYVSNRAQVREIASASASTIAIMGGTGTNITATPIERAYGQTKAQSCAGITSKALKGSTTPIECNVIKGIENYVGLVNVELEGVKCTPTIATSIGQRVSCEVSWKYGGIPGSAMSFFRNGASFSNNPALSGTNKTAGSAESQVKYPSNGLVNR